MNIDKIKELLMMNKKALIFISFGALFFLSFVMRIAGYIEVDITRKPYGAGGRKRYIIEMLLYKLGGKPLVIGFYFVVGVVLIYIGIKIFKRKT